ncbi:MAG: hypothetical protein IJC01_03515 [Clostridia bacterium]|nr:hypothetical protein [Clostridia bacterium]
MKNKWLRIYKRYLNKAEGDTLQDTFLSAHNEMMHDYWNGAIPGVPRGRYGELPPGESYQRFKADFHALLFAAHAVDDEPVEPRHIVNAWLSFWILIFVVSLTYEVISLNAGNRIFVLVCLSVMVFSLAMCTFLSIKKAEVK